MLNKFLIYIIEKSKNKIIILSSILNINDLIKSLERITEIAEIVDY
jgi:hypothetical protein